MMLGDALKVGMVLVYSANGIKEAPWTVEQVQPTRVEGLDCVRLTIRDTVDEPAETRSRCVKDAFVYELEAKSGALTPLRPWKAKQILLLDRPGGKRVRYETADTREVRVGQRRFTVVDTTVTTFDADGHAIKRLTEAYAPALDTAITGRFEEMTREGWVERSRFALEAVRDR